MSTSVTGRPILENASAKPRLVASRMLISSMTSGPTQAVEWARDVVKICS